MSTMPTMSFSGALRMLKEGHRVRRLGWNGKGMYLFLPPAHLGEEPCIHMWTAAGKDQPGWLASQADMLSDDWQVCG